jgi:hypothetical protein
MDYPTRTVSWTLLQDQVGRLEATLLDAAYTLIHRPRAAGSPEDDQLALPLRQGFFGFLHMTAQEAVATQLSVADLTQVAMRQGPSKFRAFDGPNRPL